MIAATDLCKSYRRGATLVDAIQNVTFQLAAGSKTALLGKSGSGKSTLLNLIAGLDRASSGQLEVDGENLSEATIRQLDNYRQRKIGIVFQQFRLVRHRTAAQNVELPLILSGVPRKKRQSRVDELLDRVDMLHRANHFPSELSGGEQQRIAIARSLIHDPRILLADEPTGNLDSHHAAQVMQLLEEMVAEYNTTLLLVTHDEDLAGEVSDRIIRLHDGTIIDDRSGLTAADHALNREEG